MSSGRYLYCGFCSVCPADCCGAPSGCCSLPGLGLLLCLHGRLHLVLRNERLARLDGLALPLPEIGGYPLHLLFRHTEEVEAGRVFQLVPEVGKEIRKHIAVAIHPQEVVVVLQGILGL